ncbi:phage major capsid protein [Selenomonas montiformis]|uniref:phage major capsid protein n=1 Tax=Selenomonas montiformis TaxID=2652285 RepID=UPI003F8C5292
MNFKEMIKRLEERRSALVAKSEKCDNVEELRSIHDQLQALNEDLAELRSMQKEQEESEKRGAKTPEQQEAEARTAAVNGEGEQEQRGKQPEFVPGKGFKKSAEGRSVDESAFENREQAGKELKENRSVNSPLSITGEIRSVAIGDGTSIVVPALSGKEINPNFPVVSSLVDGVDTLQLNGGESFKQPYVNNITAGNYTAEGAAAATADTTYAYASINKAKVTAYSEVTEELLKLPDAPYADNVFQNIRTSMRMLISKEILVGAGGTNQIVGIFDDGATAIDASTDLALSAITDTTLDEIVFNYGGSEEVEGTAVLILNKLDLLAFSKVRTQTKEKFYDIKSFGNTGTINGIPFIINSACKALSKDATESGEYCMAYGNLKNYKLVEFSPTEVKRSTDYKFKEGMIANRGLVMLGGNVVHKNGFLRVKKAPTV